MPEEIKIINFGGVNCYLIKTGVEYILIDTGFPAKRGYLEKELEKAGCRPGNLKLVILTHGDHDHAGNCAFLRQKYGAKIAMHADDLGMVERGDMNWNRKARSDRFSLLFRMMLLVSIFVKPGKFVTFKPDLTIDENFSLHEYGFELKSFICRGTPKAPSEFYPLAATYFAATYCITFLVNRVSSAISTIWPTVMPVWPN